MYHSNIKILDLSHNNISIIYPGYFRPAEISLTHLHLGYNSLMVRCRYLKSIFVCFEYKFFHRTPRVMFSETCRICNGWIWAIIGYTNWTLTPSRIPNSCSLSTLIITTWPIFLRIYLNQSRVCESLISLIISFVVCPIISSTMEEWKSNYIGVISNFWFTWIFYFQIGCLAQYASKDTLFITIQFGCPNSVRTAPV